MCELSLSSRSPPPRGEEREGEQVTSGIRTRPRTYSIWSFYHWATSLPVMKMMVMLIIMMIFNPLPPPSRKKTNKTKQRSKAEKQNRVMKIWSVGELETKLLEHSQGHQTIDHPADTVTEKSSRPQCRLKTRVKADFTHLLPPFDWQMSLFNQRPAYRHAPLDSKQSVNKASGHVILQHNGKALLGCADRPRREAGDVWCLPPCLESQGCHLIPRCYLLSCSSA